MGYHSNYMNSYNTFNLTLTANNSKSILMARQSVFCIWISYILTVEKDLKKYNM